MQLATSKNVLNFILFAAGSQCRLSYATLCANFVIRSRRRAAAFKISWTRSVWITMVQDNTEVAVVDPSGLVHRP